MTVCPLSGCDVLIYRDGPAALIVMMAQLLIYRPDHLYGGFASSELVRNGLKATAPSGQCVGLRPP